MILFPLAYQHRQKPESIYAKQYTESGALGEIYYANCLATHSLDLTLYLMNNYEPEMVVGKTHKNQPKVKKEHTMNYSVADFKTDKFLKLEKQDAKMGGVIERLIDFEKKNQIYNKSLWARFVDVFT